MWWARTALKCLRLPVTKGSADPAIATSRKGRSPGSGKSDIEWFGSNLFARESYEINQGIDIGSLKSKERAQQHIPEFQQNPVVI